MDPTQLRIQELQATINRQRREITSLENKNAALRREIDAFAARYKRTVQHLFEKVEAARAAIADLEDRRRQRRLHGSATPQYSWERATRFTPPDTGDDDSLPQEDLLESSQQHLRDTDLKQLYRRLARRFHPDLVTDEAERQRRTRLMTLINTAYSSGDVETLLKLDEGDGTVPDDVPAPEPTPAIDAGTLRLRQLEKLSEELAARIEDLRIEQQDLMLDPLMDLKIEEKLARTQGRNLLREIANDLTAEHRSLMQQLDKLRRSL